jgi:hypothetical protein
MQENSGPEGAAPQAALDDLLAQARTWAESVGLTRQVEQSPWLMMATAAAAGYVLGSMMGGDGESGFSGPGPIGQMAERMGRQPRRMSTSDFANRHGGSRADTGMGSSPYGMGFAPGSSDFTHGAMGAPGYGGMGSGQYGMGSGQMGFSSGGYGQPPRQVPSAADMLAPVRGEIEALKGAAIVATRHWLRDTLRQSFPSMAKQIDALDQQIGGMTGTGGR